MVCSQFMDYIMLLIIHPEMKKCLCKLIKYCYFGMAAKASNISKMSVFDDLGILTNRTFKPFNMHGFGIQQSAQ